MKSNKGFTNKAKSGAKALPARWRQAAERARAPKGAPMRALRKKR